MIYLPHPQFNFENSQGGGVVGYAASTQPCGLEIGYVHPVRPMDLIHSWLPMPPHWSIDINKVISKFEKARSGYWEGRFWPHPDTAYGFLREDGNEFGIRFLKNDKIDIIGYWIEALAPRKARRGNKMFMDDNKMRFNEFKIWIQAQCPS